MKPGRARRAFFAFLALALGLSAVGLRSAREAPANLELKLDPEALGTPEAAAYSSVALSIAPDGTASVRLQPGEAAPALPALDLTMLLPAVPRLARGNDVLTRIALIQREFNRNEVHADLGGGRDFSVANNCLKQGLWEVKLAQKDGDRSSLRYHAWFTFPREPYARLFELRTGLSYAAYEKLFVDYPGLGGLPVPLETLRQVTAETSTGALETHAGDPLQRLSEQTGKVQYVLATGVETYGDFTSAARQPIALAKFTEPGLYTTREPMKFDLTWLAAPQRLTWRRVRNARVPESFTEIEVAFANGNRLLLADSRLESLPPRSEPPTGYPDVLPLVAGIGTPVIQASAADRAKELAEDRPRYLMLLDAKGNHVDNHFAGIDGVYVWREGGAKESVHLWLVSYERIAFVAHLSAPWAPPPAAR